MRACSALTHAPQRRRVSALLVSARMFVACKGIVENRITTMYTNRTVTQHKEAYDASVAAMRHPAPRNRKEELEHLTRQCSYEYIPEFQRWANDMMAVYSDPQAYSTDMAYHYHRIPRTLNVTCRDNNLSNGACDVGRVHPHS